jgi:exodeoxyribonuclease V alpha subunit
MSIHQSQGSEFPHVVVALPPPPSRILTRELFYTGVTRAQQRLTVVASEASVRLAVERRVARASGLYQRLTSGTEII